MNFLISGNNETSNGLCLFIVYCGWKLKTMFGNKQQHAENMDVKKIVFEVRILYLLCCILKY